MLLQFGEEIQEVLPKMRWIRDWFIHMDYTSGEMIRTWFLIHGFHRMERWWHRYMMRRFNARYPEDY